MAALSMYDGEHVVETENVVTLPTAPLEDNWRSRPRQRSCSDTGLTQQDVANATS